MSDPYALVAQAGALLSALSDREEPRVYRALPGELPRTDPACLWARARQRYLRRIRALPVPTERPVWWMTVDAHAPPACRTCRHWRSQDALAGYCAMEETTGSVNCGATRAGDLCEQWDAWQEARKQR